MRSNGLTLALTTLLAPACAFAQHAPAPVAQTPAATATEEPANASESSSAAVEAPAVQPPASDADPLPKAPDAPAQAEGAADGAAQPASSPFDSSQSGEDPAARASEESGETSGAERTFAPASGAPPYNPVADQTVPETAVLPGAYDPWEKYNRKMHRFNNAVDRRIAKPLARGYVAVVPRPVRLGVSNFFSNLGQPLTTINSLLQGKGKQAGQSFGRFLLNSTFGIGGIFDPATRANLPRKSEDFGQTLGVWGWKRSRYVELPLFGPRTVRDVFGMAGDAPLSPLRSVEADRIRVPLQGLQLVDMRAHLLATDSLREGAADDYALVRDAWSQRRDYQIFGERVHNGEDLPDYLREGDYDSTVPVDAIPVTVPDGS